MSDWNMLFHKIKRFAILRSILGVFILLAVSDCAAQLPELVVPDLKEGVDTIFYDSTFSVVEKQVAHFYAFTYFHLGKDVWNENHKWRKQKHVMVWSGCQPGSTGSPVPLHGVLKWFTRGYDRLIAQEQFDNGKNKGQTLLYDRRARLLEVVDYDKNWNSMEWSFYDEKYHRGKLSKASYEIYDINACSWKSICTMGCYVSKDLRP
jgi:hypothetical protein